MTRLPKFRGDRRLLSLHGLRGIERNVRQTMDGLEMLGKLPDRIAAVVFLDPQYRSVLDKMEFGNEGERNAGRAALPQMTDKVIRKFIGEVGRVLRPSGHLFLWVDKFGMATGLFREWLADLPRNAQLEVVDLIAWNKMRPGMGRRARCSTEYCIVIQRPPVRAKGIWTDHSLRDCWAEYSDREIHTHCKPYALTERLIRATTVAGDLIVDPCAGGYGVLEAALATGREFVGCDVLGD
jgi:site-specific DNA-methyltransferase (adenine-specific)